MTGSGAPPPSALSPSSWWWIRHGPTHARSMIGWTDRPADLSDHAALDWLRDQLPAAAVVISSDLSRTRATAEALQATRPRLPDAADLREIHFGAWEDLTHGEAEATDPARIRAFWESPGEVAAPGGESWNALSRRVDATVDRLAAAHAEVIAVAHFGVILTQVQRALGLSAAEAFAHHIAPLSLTRLRCDGRGWRAEAINLRAPHHTA